MRVLTVVEDDPDVQFLIECVFSPDSRFQVTGMASSAEDGLELARTNEPGIIVLDHGLAGTLTGIAAAPLLKNVAPQSNIILFTADAELRRKAEAEPAIDAFLLKTESAQLLAIAQRLAGFGPRSV